MVLNQIHWEQNNNIKCFCVSVLIYKNKKLSDVFKKSEFITKFIAQLATSRKEKKERRKRVSFRFSLSLFYNPEHKKAKLLLRINIFTKNHFFASLIVEKGNFLVSVQVKNCGLKVTEVVRQLSWSTVHLIDSSIVRPFDKRFHLKLLSYLNIMQLKITCHFVENLAIPSFF